jgi:hypothetical protein
MRPQSTGLISIYRAGLHETKLTVEFVPLPHGGNPGSIDKKSCQPC